MLRVFSSDCMVEALPNRWYVRPRGTSKAKVVRVNASIERIPNGIFALRINPPEIVKKHVKECKSLYYWEFNTFMEAMDFASGQLDKLGSIAATIKEKVRLQVSDISGEVYDPPEQD